VKLFHVFAYLCGYLVMGLVTTPAKKNRAENTNYVNSTRLGGVGLCSAANSIKIANIMPGRPLCYLFLFAVISNS
jgi:hypothetical protein